MYPHRIRLRGPWVCEPIGPGAPDVRQVAIPGRLPDFGLVGFRGPLRLTRKFGYPGRADPDMEHIWITCAGCTDGYEVRLNGQVLSVQAIEQFACDVTSVMSERNQLEILIEATTDDAGVWGEVAIEIRRDAFLSDVSVERIGSGLAIVGRAFGKAPQPLELYTLVDKRHADYRVIMPTTNGTPFRIELLEVASAHQLVRVELVHVSAIWYSVELAIPDSLSN